MFPAAAAAAAAAAGAPAEAPALVSPPRAKKQKTLHSFFIPMNELDE